MTFDDIEALRQEDWIDVDGSPCPLPSPASIAKAREIHAAVLALGPVPEGAELEVDADVNGGCAVNLYSADYVRDVWFRTRQDGSHNAVLADRDAAMESKRHPSIAGLSLRDQVISARRFVGWPL